MGECRKKIYVNENKVKGTQQSSGNEQTLGSNGSLLVSQIKSTSSELQELSILRLN